MSTFGNIISYYACFLKFCRNGLKNPKIDGSRQVIYIIFVFFFLTQVIHAFDQHPITTFVFAQMFLKLIVNIN